MSSFDHLYSTVGIYLIDTPWPWVWSYSSLLSIVFNLFLSNVAHHYQTQCHLQRPAEPPLRSPMTAYASVSAKLVTDVV